MTRDEWVEARANLLEDSQCPHGNLHWEGYCDDCLRDAWDAGQAAEPPSDLVAGYLPGAKVGDRFRWRDSLAVCRITGTDMDEIRYDYETGYHAGQWGSMTLPQDVELIP